MRISLLSRCSSGAIFRKLKFIFETYTSNFSRACSNAIFGCDRLPSADSRRPTQYPTATDARVVADAVSLRGVGNRGARAREPSRAESRARCRTVLRSSDRLPAVEQLVLLVCAIGATAGHDTIRLQ